MRKAVVYILYSNSLDRFYIGFTSLNPEERLDKHLNKYYEGAWTRIANDWELYWQLECNSLKQAMETDILRSCVFSIVRAKSIN